MADHKDVKPGGSNAGQAPDTSRRQFMKNSGLVVGGVAGGSLLGGLLTNQFKSDKSAPVQTDTKKVELTEARMFFSRYEDFVVLEQATERILPKDDNGPGAIELGVPYFIDKQMAGNFEIRNNAHVKRILHDGKKATGVLYVDPLTLEEFEQPADLVVSAAFFSGNNRLMMLSEIGEQYNPETGKGVIGKNFTSHYTGTGGNSATAFFEDKKFNTFAGAGALGCVIDDFNGDHIDNTDTDFLLGFNISIFQDGAAAISNNRVPQGTPYWGKEFKEKSIHYAHRYLNIGGMQGTLPRTHNYLDLDPTYKDIYGDPLLRITAKFTDQERNMARAIAEKCAEIAEEMGADIVNTPPVSDDVEMTSSSVNTHAAGGMIMGTDPEISAVNTYSQVWDMENVFVVGGSSFPHFGNSNPTETIGAFAYRATEGMINYLKGDGGLLVEPKSSKATV